LVDTDTDADADPDADRYTSEALAKLLEKHVVSAR